MWSEAHRPKRLEEMVGNGEVREKLASWLVRWKKGSKALMLVGPPGTGKTTTVQLAARKLGFNLVQLNASDRRTKEMLSQKLGEAVRSTNLFGERTLIFLDEVDGLSGRADYGAVDYIKESVRSSENPIVMAANDPDAEEVRKLSSVASSLLFVKPTEREVEGYLRTIAAMEKRTFTDEEFSQAAGSANGDVRAAINALQGGTPAAKDEEMTAAQSVNAFFDASSEGEAIGALRRYPGQPRDKVRDLFVSVTRSKIHPTRKAAALEALSLADVLMGRMTKGRDWRLLRYLDPLLASDLRLALGDGGVRYSEEAVPWPLQLRIWNDARRLRDLTAMAARRTRISRKGFAVEDMPYLLVLCRDEKFRDGVVRSLGLEENHAAFLAREAARTRRA